MTSLTGYTACCGADILYGFSYDPNEKGGGYKIVTNPTTGVRQYAEPRTQMTWEEQFNDRLDQAIKMSNSGGRMFSCILTEGQLKAYKGGWAKIIKGRGFEFVRRWTNAGHGDPEYLYLFVLCTDAKNRCKGDFTVPPEGWDSIEEKPKVLATPAVKKPAPAPPVPRPRQAPRGVGPVHQVVAWLR